MADVSVSELTYVEGRMPAFMQHFRARWLAGDLPFSSGEQRARVFCKFPCVMRGVLTKPMCLLLPISFCLSL